MTIKKALIIFVLAFVASSVEANAECSTNVSGIMVNAVWTKDQSPYCVEDDILVAGLRIEPGVAIEVLGNYVFEVAGVIKAKGAAGDPILFNKADSNTTGWQGVYFNFSSPGSVLEYCIIEGSVNSGVRIVNSHPAMRYCTIQNNSAAMGGGVFIDGTMLGFKNCNIVNNTATALYGGGVYAVNGEVLFIDTNIEENTATGGNYAAGGGIYSTGKVTLINSSIINNTVSSSTFGPPHGYGYGGGVYFSGSFVLSNSYISDNTVYVNTQSSIRTSNSYGGGIYTDGRMILTNSIVVGNSVDGNRGGVRLGGALYLNVAETTSVVNGTIADNVGEGITNAAATFSMTNSIVWNNSTAQITGPADVTYSDVQGGFAGEGNININPILDPSYRIVPGSLCIDAGNPAAQDNDICFPPSLGTDQNDMGIDGGPHACNWIYKNGDFDLECDVDGMNLADFTTFYNSGDPAADLNNDGIVNGTDMAIFAARVGSASCYSLSSI